MPKKSFTIPTAPIFYVLLSLATRERHGYDIMNQTWADSNETVKLGPGSLYGAIKQMIENDLIEESDERPDALLDDQRRRYYRLTNQGKAMLQAELDRMQTAIKVAGSSYSHPLAPFGIKL